MFASLRALLTGLIDYAGLFPPAKLPLEPAVRNYAAYRQSADAWMLGRFICPAAQLAELAPFVDELFQAGPPLAISALGRGGNTLAEYLTGLGADFADVQAFRKRHGKQVGVDVLEVRLPSNVGLEKPAHPLWFAGNDAAFRTARLTLFCELPPPLPVYLVLRQLGQAADNRPIGFKLRCGGLEASAFPSVEQVANALSCSLKAGVRFKATAGLHHPFPRFDPDIGARMHGFINLIAAGILAHVRGAGPERIQAILEDEDPAHFVCTDSGLRWNDLHATTEEVIAARRDAVLSFGSCSFDEPRDDLRALGWL
jgi:hypothetical protein